MAITFQHIWLLREISYCQIQGGESLSHDGFWRALGWAFKRSEGKGNLHSQFVCKFFDKKNNTALALRAPKLKEGLPEAKDFLSIFHLERIKKKEREMKLKVMLLFRSFNLFLSKGILTTQVTLQCFSHRMHRQSWRLA